MSLRTLACAVRSHLINIVTRQISISRGDCSNCCLRRMPKAVRVNRPYQWTAEQAVLTDSIAVNEIGKRTLHPLEHAPRFFLGPMEGMLDSCLGAANDSAFVVAILSCCFHILHGRTGKHSFRAPDRAATRTDIDRADRAGRFICERDNPDGLTPFIRAERVTGGRKTRVRFFRSMTRDRVRAVGIEI